MDNKLSSQINISEQEDLTKIDLPQDHQEKYNIDISDANKKMLERLGKANPAPAKEGIEYDKEAGRVLHTRSSRDYRLIKKAFEDQELNTGEFEKAMGYGKKHIRKIGWKKFIKAMDWRRPEDVKKYKTDVMHIVPCINCHSEFAVFEDNVGLCKSCEKLFDMDRFWATYQAINQAQTNVSETKNLIALFYSFPDFREKYRFKSQRKELDDLIEENLWGVETFYFFTKTIPNAVAEGIPYSEYKKSITELFTSQNNRKFNTSMLDRIWKLVEADLPEKDWYDLFTERLKEMIKEQN